MIKDSRLGKIDRIYVKNVTRFARNSLECIENIRILKENGTSVYFENDGIDTDSMNSEMILFIKSAFAQSEALSGSKRVSTACRMRMERGSFVTTCAPFGYRLIEKQVIVVPEEAEIVRKIYELCLQGLGTNKIIAELNENAGEYAPWGREQIRYILHNEKYVGDSLWQKTFTPAVLPLRSKPNRGEVDQYYTEDTQEAIIDKATFQKAQQMLNRRTEKWYLGCNMQAFSIRLYTDSYGFFYQGDSLFTRDIFNHLKINSHPWEYHSFGMYPFLFRQSFIFVA